MSRPPNFKDFLRKFFFIEKWKEYKNHRPSKKQWLSFFKIISLPEKILFSLFLLVFIFSGFFWWRENYILNTKVVPKEGGKMSELIIGKPQNLNPLFAPLNDADRDISEIIFAGLLKYTPEGKLKEDLAKNYKIEKDGKTYVFTLKDNIYWSDGEKITTDDVLFTMNLIQNAETQSPLRIIFQGVNAKKVDQQTIIFTTQEPSPSFLENFTLKIIPKHIFKDVKPQELSSFIPQKFVSSGPFKVKKIIKKNEKIKKIILEKNNIYYNPPYIQLFEIYFANEEELAFFKNNVSNIGAIPYENLEEFEKYYKIKKLSVPRYFGLFLNQKNELLKEKSIREALFWATPKEKIIKEVFRGNARKVDSIFLEENGVGKNYKAQKFNIKKAKEILEKEGWKKKNKEGVLEKKINDKNYSLVFTIFTADQRELKKVAEIIKETWKEIGIKVEIKTYPPQQLLQDVIKERKYEILLFGENLTMIPEPYYFWHSSQIKYPGLNLSLYENKEVDKILEKEVKEMNLKERNKILNELQKKITEEMPAIFLYSPNYLYGIKKQIKGFNGKYILDPSKRFINIENWYIKEKRIPIEKTFQRPQQILPSSPTPTISLSPTNTQIKK